MIFQGRRWHFMGVGGIGVSALAEMAARRGAVVSGCDRESGPVVDALLERGIEIFIGHDPAHAAEADVLVYSSAIPPDHPERLAAGGREVRRGELLARFMDEAATSVGVAGTHGKTTTAWLLGHLLIKAGLDPTLYVGGIAPDLPMGNYRLGTGPFAAELDESDESFLLPRLDIAVLTNVESDHLGHYRDFSAVTAAFGRYARGVSERGLLVAGIDDPGARRIFMNHEGGKLSFGLSREADLHPEALVAKDGTSAFHLIRRGDDFGEFHLPLPGRHNVENALAALGVALELGADPESLRDALPAARGVDRRLELLGTIGRTLLYSDYAHHPTEVAATIRAVREMTSGRVLAVFQPHLFSRTRDYAPDFARALALADAAMLLDVYPAREEPIPGVDSRMILDIAVREDAAFDITGPFALRDVGDAVIGRAADFSVVVMMGAGSIDQAARRIVPEGER